ncbi:Glu/Leu/Phe/Val dehydrogenase dimerization domain-containing protein [Rubrimonas cliftonensis]|uniref:Leucine dehydrogenase n=1 Tax=Rubrimonas cliftonensis TaxID=89524 RepID=A0A1H4DV80_9RHOB|nr:Glu/Leu/Phe/Val dehydrogenase dimerization domain-containing protein [Rubrimonas cliftonensis]SEA76280.1 leucine dehydrogenase [Rubrimonas cliftonensis]
MHVFDSPDFDDHEQVIFASDAATGLRAVIAVHSTALGPALGGCRIHAYADEADAARDALRLSRGMTYKAALAGLALGGGKSVVLADPARDKTPAMMRAMGRAVERLSGRYIAAEDMGATVADMDAMADETAHVTGRSPERGGVGDPSPWTARGVFLCLEAAVRLRLGRGLAGARVCVKGLGSVGWKLAEALHGAGAALTVADIRDDVAARAAGAFGAAVIPVEAALAAEVDVYAPCAMGGEFNIDTIPALGAQIICGAANNQLAEAADGGRLAARGALYCPDYLVNAGGLIRVAQPPLGMDEGAALARLEALPRTLETVLAESARSGATPAEVADALARRRFAPAAG